MLNIISNVNKFNYSFQISTMKKRVSVIFWHCDYLYNYDSLRICHFIKINLSVNFNKKPKIRKIHLSVEILRHCKFDFIFREAKKIFSPIGTPDIMSVVFQKIGLFFLKPKKIFSPIDTTDIMSIVFRKIIEYYWKWQKLYFVFNSKFISTQFSKYLRNKNISLSEIDFTFRKSKKFSSPIGTPDMSIVIQKIIDFKIGWILRKPKKNIFANRYDRYYVDNVPKNYWESLKMDNYILFLFQNSAASPFFKIFK